MDLSVKIDLKIISGFSVVKVCMQLHASVVSSVSNEVWIWASFFKSGSVNVITVLCALVDLHETWRFNILVAHLICQITGWIESIEWSLLVYQVSFLLQRKRGRPLIWLQSLSKNLFKVFRDWHFKGTICWCKWWNEAVRMLVYHPKIQVYSPIVSFMSENRKMNEIL